MRWRVAEKEGERVGQRGGEAERERERARERGREGDGVGGWEGVYMKGRDIYCFFIESKS